MNSERLLRLADHMERVDPKNYNQGYWLDVSPDQSYWLDGSPVDICPAPNDFDPSRLVVREGACGTVMCVLGHAVAAVPDAGMWFSGDQFPFWAVVRYRNPETGHVYEAFRAASRVFDLPEDHAKVLFSGTDEPSTYVFYTGLEFDYEKDGDNFHDFVTPTTVAVALRRYVETDGETVRTAMKTAADLLEKG